MQVAFCFVVIGLDLFRPLGLGEVVITQNYVYVAPIELNQVYQLNLEGDVVRIIGRKGEGPGEFDFVNLVGHRGDQILAIAMRRRSPPFEFSTEGALLATHRLPDAWQTNWVYKTTKGWLYLEADAQWIRFFQSQENFGESTLLVSEPKDFQEKELRFNKVFWKISRDGRTFFLVRNKATELFVADLSLGTQTSVPLEINPIPDPESDSGFWGKRETLPLVTDIVAGPAGTCLLYLGEHLIQKDLPPRVFEADGTLSSRRFSAESWRRLLEVRGMWAWITTFDEDTGAGIRKLNVVDVDTYTEKHPIAFSEEDRMAYMKNSLQRKQ